ncbi:transcriptional regulator [Synechococcus sp. PCC 7502]|uniref:TetR family transcriptional regulator n=1 Tax=Synechococcus sp. PCC 7502 TaxID=1173263 RepID=UPI00029FAE05|nr:TetR family transcriptional regulator [Synechococcus sp. PCC 7502]AFY74870.1 transcriptional regulator [Synechococcus sp. PCC 7502]
MALERIPTRQKIVNTALELFARQGITETTTRQIADRAEVNEVTLFRHFGNKHGLLLAVLQEFLQEYLLVTQLGESLIPSEFKSTVDLSQFLYHYMQSSLHALESVPELMRSLVGEAGQYPQESRHALAQGITEINRAIANALQEAKPHLNSTSETLSLAKIMNACILGYTIMVLTSDVELIWSSKDEFIDSLVKLLIPKSSSRLENNPEIQDIPEVEVRNILLQAKRQGLRDYAIAYVLFGAGLSADELVNLNQTDYSIDYSINKAGILKIQERLVPLNQKIFGHRYGTANNNPLTNYLKSRKDKHPRMFLSNTAQPLSTSELEQLWRSWHNLSFEIAQTQHTWRIEMLRRGIDHENFQIISGLPQSEILAYDLKVKEYLALQQAIALDKST